MQNDLYVLRLRDGPQTDTIPRYLQSALIHSSSSGGGDVVSTAAPQSISGRIRGYFLATCSWYCRNKNGD